MHLFGGGYLGIYLDYCMHVIKVLLWEEAMIAFAYPLRKALLCRGNVSYFNTKSGHRERSFSIILY